MEVSSRYKALKVNGKKVDEHRYIMEQILGRKLRRDEVVHHKNGNRYDNRPENLEVMRLSDHSRKHMSGVSKSDKTKEKLSSALKGRRVHSKFTEEDIQYIRVSADNGASPKELAAQYNVYPSTIYRILSHKSYSDIV